jgi:hypothetical protein
MKLKAILLALLLIPLLESCSRQGPVIFDGVSWGMSKEDVRLSLQKSDVSLLYKKGHPLMDEDGNYSMFQNELMYQRNFPSSNIDCTVSYYFDKENQLERIEISTGDVWSRTCPECPPNPEFKLFSDKKRFGNFETTMKAMLFDTTQAELADKARNYSDPTYSDNKFVYDEIYKTLMLEFNLCVTMAVSRLHFKRDLL